MNNFEYKTRPLRPLKIKAVQWTGENIDEIKEFAIKVCELKDDRWLVAVDPMFNAAKINFIDHYVSAGRTDWFIYEHYNLKVMSDKNFRGQYER